MTKKEILNRLYAAGEWISMVAVQENDKYEPHVQEMLDGIDEAYARSALFYNEKIPEKMEKHAVDRYLDFVRYLEGSGSDIRSFVETPEFTITVGGERLRRTPAPRSELSKGVVAEEKRGEGTESGGVRKAERRYVAVNPIAFWETKLSENNKFAELGDRIRQELGIDVVLTGSEAGPLEKIKTRMKTAAVNLGGQTTLRELASLYRDASLVITTRHGLHRVLCRQRPAELVLLPVRLRLLARGVCRARDRGARPRVLRPPAGKGPLRPDDAAHARPRHRRLTSGRMATGSGTWPTGWTTPNRHGARPHAGGGGV